jgi:hypothetical protein
MNKCTLLSFALSTSLLLAPAAEADSTLEFLVKETRAPSAKTQPVLIKDGKIMVKGAGGDAHLDVLYDRDRDELVIIDHHKHTFMAVDERQVNRIAQQTEDVQPLLKGLGEQIRKLSPKQREKWGQMLGGNISLDKLAKAAEPLEPASLVKTGTGKNVAGVACQAMNVIQGSAPMAEICLADPAKMNISSDDYATIRALFGFSEKLAAKTQGLAGQFGIKIPNIALHDVAGIPVEMRDLSEEHLGSMTLSRIETSAVSPDLMQIPSGYKAEQLALWK